MTNDKKETQKKCNFWQKNRFEKILSSLLVFVLFSVCFFFCMFSLAYAMLHYKVQLDQFHQAY